LNAPVALTSLAFDRRLTGRIVVAALVANLAAGWYNGYRDRHYDPIAIEDRVLAAFSCILVGALSFGTQRAARGAASVGRACHCVGDGARAESGISAGVRRVGDRGADCRVGTSTASSGATQRNAVAFGHPVVVGFRISIAFGLCIAFGFGFAPADRVGNRIAGGRDPRESAGGHADGR